MSHYLALPDLTVYYLSLHLVQLSLFVSRGIDNSFSARDAVYMYLYVKWTSTIQKQDIKIRIISPDIALFPTLVLLYIHTHSALLRSLMAGGMKI